VKWVKCSQPAQSRNDNADKENTNTLTTSVDDEEESADDSMVDDERFDLEVPAAAKHKKGRKREGGQGVRLRLTKMARVLALRSEYSIGKYSTRKGS
jgi:hypothetical protein